LVNNPNMESPSAALYTIRLIGGCLLVFAFALFVLLWVDILRFDKKRTMWARRCVFVLCLIYLCFNIYVIFKCWQYGMEKIFDLFVYKLYFWCAGTWLLFASLGFLIYGIKIHWTIRRIIHDYDKQVKMLLKLTGVIAVCFCCCLIRVVCLAVLYITDFSQHELIITSEQYYFTWDLFSYFLPYYGLLGTMVYVTRKADQQPKEPGAPALENVEVSTSLQNPLISTDEDDPLSERHAHQHTNSQVMSSASNIQEYLATASSSSTSTTSLSSSFTSQKLKTKNPKYTIQPSSLTTANDVSLSLSPDAHLLGHLAIGSQNDDVFTEV